ncbi:unnamed protein product [Urochloa decumbens]|uniref:F-box domain-containing protein n=1 Tax=Urochloa decumbens TaxID=240449 RepID=A0ABC9F2G1_9POAL
MEPPPPTSRERAAAVDRLSDLPDGVLLDVLSRLTFRQAVSTGALSRRWRSLWHAVPYPTSRIDIDHSVSRGQDDHIDSADRVTTSAGEDPLGAFRVRVADRDGLNAAHRWIRRSLARRPMAVAIRCDAAGSPYSTERPEFSFHQYCHGGRAFMGRLRALQLYRVKLENEFSGAIANNLPVLEDLRLHVCDSRLTRIASASLQNLDILSCTASSYYVRVIALAAPRLATLRIHCNPTPVAAEGEMPSLVAATLDHWQAGAVGLLGSLSHAMDLSLHGFPTSALLGGGEEPKGFPVFRNLRNLVLYNCDIGVECQALRRILRNSPSLETLALRLCKFFGGSRSNKRKARSSSSGGRRVPASYACNNLKWVELTTYHDDELDELDDALEEISQGVFELYEALKEIPKKVVHPIESSVQHGRRTVRIAYE